MSLHTWRTEAFDIQEGVRQGVLFKASYEVSLAFPQSITKTTSLIVILVSARFVASTIFLQQSAKKLMIHENLAAA